MLQPLQVDGVNIIRHTFPASCRITITRVGIGLGIVSCNGGRYAEQNSVELNEWCAK